MITYIVSGLLALFAIITLFNGFFTIRPTERGLIERFGKYKRFVQPGLGWKIPYIDRLIEINITEMMIDAEPQEIITNDNLNAIVDAQVYFKIMPIEEAVKNSIYNVQNAQYQIVNLIKTTLRSIVGTMTLKSANSERGKINEALLEQLQKETADWGMQIVRAELKEITPPQDVQNTMNKVVIAANEKLAAVDFATAQETQADGKGRAITKEAEGRKKAQVLEAEGEAEAVRVKAIAQAEAIKIVNESAAKYFKGDAQLLKKLEVYRDVLKDNTKLIIPAGSDIINVLGGDMNKILPLRK